MQKKKKKKHSPWKKAQKALQPIKKKWATEKSTMVLLKALTTIPDLSHAMYSQ